jgi:hypothetical protein
MSDGQLRSGAMRETRENIHLQNHDCKSREEILSYSARTLAPLNQDHPSAKQFDTQKPQWTRG